MDNTSEDGDYEVSAEMLIHEDIDDERTLQEEEERMEEEGEGGDTEDELIDLQKESELPLEEVLASYGYPRSPSLPQSTAEPQQTNKPQLVIKVNEEGVASTDPKPHPPKLIHVPPEVPTPVRPNFEPLPQQQEEPGMSGEEDEGDVPPASSEDKLDSVSSQSGSKSPWFRPGANPEALARLRPVPERRSIRMGGAGGGANSSAVDNAFKVWLASDANSGVNDDSSNDDSDEEYYVSNDWKKVSGVLNTYPQF